MYGVLVFCQCFRLSVLLPHLQAGERERLQACLESGRVARFGMSIFSVLNFHLCLIWVGIIGIIVYPL